MLGPAYRIETPRLVIRCWDPRDAAAIVEAVEASREHLHRYAPWSRQEVTLATYVDWTRKARGRFDLGEDFVYGIFDPQGRLLGGLGSHTRLGPEARELGYWIRADSAGKGIVTEAAAAMARVAFEIDRVTRVEIHCDPTNVRSAAVAARLNFRLDGTLRRRLPHVDGARDRQIWSLFADEYPGSPASRGAARAFDAIGAPIDALPSPTGSPPSG